MRRSCEGHVIRNPPLQVIELPVKHPEPFESLGIAQPKVHPASISMVTTRQLGLLMTGYLLPLRACCYTVPRVQARLCWHGP